MRESGLAFEVLAGGDGVDRVALTEYWDDRTPYSVHTGPLPAAEVPGASG